MTQTDTSRPASPAPSARPLCVDLDGTLVATDTVWEAIVQLLRQKPWLAWMLPAKALGGRAALKCWLTGHVRLNAAELPYRPAVLAFLREQKQAGRLLVLTTGADAAFARDVADHLGLFDQVVGTRVDRNCTGRSKCQAITDALGPDQPFDYIGDSRADLPVWASAERAYLVNPTRRVQRRVVATGRMERVFDEPGSGNHLGALLVSMRPHQWVKNGLLAVPMLVGQEITDLVRWWWLFVAIACFSLASSAVYLVNDLLDLAADRQHPTKRRRPLAAGLLPIPLAVAAVPLLLLLAVGVAAWLLPAAFAGWVACYVVLAVGYSWAGKGKAILDVIWLAGLYTLRLLAGGVAVNVPPSEWLLAFAMFVFLSLAFAKRHAELARIEQQHGTAAAGRGYFVTDLSLIGTVGPVAGYMAVLVFALYITSDSVVELYRKPEALWLVCPLLVYWLTRLWLKAHRRELREDPVMFALTDPATYGVLGLIGGVAAVAALWP